MSLKLYWLIKSSPILRKALLPEDANKAPYEVLDYNTTLLLRDPYGIRATEIRRERVRFLQNGISAMLDHFWGDGAVAHSYEHTAGPIRDSFKVDEVRHVLVGLKKLPAKGEQLSFGIARSIVGGFTKKEEWVETVADHPVGRLTRNVVFPTERPCKKAVLRYGEDEFELPVVELSNGRTLVSFEAPTPEIDAKLTVYWEW